MIYINQIKEVIEVVNSVITSHGVLGLKDHLEETDTYETLCNKLGKKGYNLLGSGFFAVAYLIPNSDKVIKIGLKPDVDAGFTYLQLCKSLQYMVGCPKIHHLSQYGKYYLAVLDRYTPFDEWVSLEEHQDNFPESNEIYESYKALSVELEPPYSRSVQRERMVGKLRATHPIKEFFNKIKELCSVADADCHSGNVMVDLNKKELVITDPFSEMLKMTDKYRKNLDNPLKL